MDCNVTVMKKITFSYQNYMVISWVRFTTCWNEMFETQPRHQICRGGRQSTSWWLLHVIIFERQMFDLNPVNDVYVCHKWSKHCDLACKPGQPMRSNCVSCLIEFLRILQTVHQSTSKYCDVLQKLWKIFRDSIYRIDVDSLRYPAV